MLVAVLCITLLGCSLASLLGAAVTNTSATFQCLVASSVTGGQGEDYLYSCSGHPTDLYKVLRRKYL